MTLKSKQLLAILVILLCLCGAQKTLAESGAKIGSVFWVVTEGDTSTVVAKGQKSLVSSDVVIINKGTLKDKQIALNEHFSFSLADGVDSPKTESGDGFGLTGNRDGPDKLFSWDWFEVDGKGHAKKLQESGEIAYVCKQIGTGGEITSTEFLTDVSIRVKRLEDGPGAKPRWRIKILKGSMIRWPSAD